MPNFACANLEDADFDYHSLFPGILTVQRIYRVGSAQKPNWLPSIPAYLKPRLETSSGHVSFNAINAYPPKFAKANLKNAKMDRVRFFWISTDIIIDPYLRSS